MKLWSKLKMTEECKYAIFFLFVLFFSFHSGSLASFHCTQKDMFNLCQQPWPVLCSEKSCQNGPLKQQMAQFIYDSAKKTISRMFIGQELHWNRECLKDLLHCLLFTVYVAVMPWGHNQNQRSRRRLKEWWSCLQFETITLSLYVLSSLSSRMLLYPSNKFLFKNLLPLASYFRFCLAAVLGPVVTPVVTSSKRMFKMEVSWFTFLVSFFFYTHTQNVYDMNEVSQQLTSQCF